ncbi:MAG: hypothetical protein ACI89L_001449 [Phycisphaerales bacterium]|jgi:hypothetical protein
MIERAPRPRLTPRWTSLVGLALRARIHDRARLIRNTRHWQTNSAGIQRSQLTQLLLAARDTEFGKAHGFDRMLEIEDADERLAAYRDAVPIVEPAAFKEPLSRMREQGQRDVLWPGLVKRFAQTSGTTAGDKFIPVSDEMMRANFLASLDIFAHLHNRGVSLTGLMGGKSLFLGGSSDLHPNEHGVTTADLSGLVTPMIRWPLSKIYSPGPEIALMSDWPAKIEAMAEQCSREDIRFISGMPSWALVLMERVIEKAKEQGKAASCVRDVWPKLTVFVHGGVNYRPFAQRVANLYSGEAGLDLPERVELYPASEAFVAIQDEPLEPGMRLLVDNFTFYEFVPLEEIDNDNPSAFTCETVEKGQKYVVVLSSCAGLWRYILGDVVEFDSIPDRLGEGVGGSESSGAGGGGDGPCRLRIVGRHRHFMNAFGENLIGEHIETGVAEAANQTGLTVGEFTASPVYADGERRAGMELAIELQAGDGAEPSPEALAAFGEAFDLAVKAVNVDYTTKRTDSLGMAPPTVTPLAMGTVHRWMASMGKLGGQHKCPRCANHREILEGIVAAGQGVSSL